VQDLMDFLTQALGLNPLAGANPDAKLPGAALDPVTGIISVNGNTGSVNDLRVDPTDLRVLDSSGALLGSPLSTAKTQAADGESVRTTFVVFDSLGTPVPVDITMVLDSTSNAGTRWRYYAESADDSDLALALGTGLVDFDTNGQLATQLPITLTIDRDSTGAGTPLSFNLALSGSQDNVTALTDSGSAIAATFRDGSSIGTLASFAVGSDGTISGSFTNGATRTLGQVALATFANNEGLVDNGSNLFLPGPNSGTPLVSAPLTLGAGKIVGGALELSNVDLSQEFIGLILSSTGYSASSRVIQTCNDLMQQLLVLGR
jgi:flagellar hook protein FlgE